MKRARMLTALAAAVALSLASPGGVGAQSRIAPTDAPAAFVATWAASPAPPYAEGPSAEGFVEETVRTVVRVSVGGSHVRVRMSNAFGERPVTLGRVTVGRAGGAAALRPGAVRTLTFRWAAPAAFGSGGRRAQ